MNTVRLMMPLVIKFADEASAEAVHRAISDMRAGTGKEYDDRRFDFSVELKPRVPLRAVRELMKTKCSGSQTERCRDRATQCYTCPNRKKG